MTDASKYVTDEAAAAALNSWVLTDGDVDEDMRAALAAAAPHIIAAAEPDILASVRNQAMADTWAQEIGYCKGYKRGREDALREVARDWDQDIATGYNQATTEAAEGKGPGAAAALRWAAVQFDAETARSWWIHQHLHNLANRETLQQIQDGLAAQSETAEDQP